MKRALPLVLMFSLFGLLSLLLIANYFEPKEVPIILLQEYIDSDVKISGKVISASYSDDASFFRIKDNSGEIRVVAFDNVSQIRKNDFVSVNGKVDIYQGKVEVIADQISFL